MTLSRLYPWALIPLISLLPACPEDPGGDGSSSSGGSGSSSGGTSSSGGNVCSGPNKIRPPLAPPIVNGTRAPTLVNLSAAQINAVVAWGAPGYTEHGFCSGTLVAPAFVLTAVHCTEVFNQGLSLDQTRILFGQDDGHPLLSIQPLRYTKHPTQDLLIVELSEDPTTQIDVEPIPISETDLTQDDVNASVENAGFGMTDPNTQVQSGRFFVVETLEHLGDSQYGGWPSTLHVLGVYGHNQRGVCGGDSGGPSMMMMPGGVRVFGALHGGEGSCTGHDEYTRIDIERDWAYGLIGSPQGGCGAVTAAGSCNSGNTVASWCENSQVQHASCSNGQVCGWSAGASGYRCVDGSTDPCGGVARYGACDGQTLRWCDNGTLRTRPCDQCGEHCALVDDTTGYACVSGAAPTTDLGLTCTQDNPCPHGSTCLVSSQGASVGLCAPVCTTDDDCPYAGPGTGACIWSISNDPNTYCGIFCGSGRACPAGFSPVDEAAQGGSVCVCEIP